jgi:D-threo-aldose 1-dehydrogenase
MCGWLDAVGYPQFEDVIVAAFEGGVRYFDCAPAYGLGKMEHYLGHLLRTREIRSQVTISTKAGRVLHPMTRSGGRALTEIPDNQIPYIDPLPFFGVYDYTFDGIMRSFEDSQQRLGIDHVEILHVHEIGRLAHGEKNALYWSQLRNGGFRALDELRSGGAVGAIGIGVNETAAVLEMSQEFRLDCCLIAGPYTLLNHEPLHDFLPECMKRNISVIGAGVFNSGILAGGTNGSLRLFDYQDAPLEIVERVRRIEAVCEEFHIPLATAAVQFVFGHPAVACVLLGARNTAEIEQNLSAMAAHVPGSFWDALRERGLIPADAPLGGTVRV